ncbi:MAG: dihydropteroate synthase, partial [Paramuribaculum sp.]|nr:dihydropteroate synthase [Paramuribaculum sp.]
MKPFTLNIKGKLKHFDRPLVMGIINATPDSFYSPSRALKTNIEAVVVKMIEEGVDIIDLGAYSSRPGSQDVSECEEIERLEWALRKIRSVSDSIIISVDTFRAEVARVSVLEYGADIVNDISGGLLDSAMIPAVAKLKVPYVLMHMRGNPQTMQQHCNYPAGVTAGVIKELSQRIIDARLAGICDIIVDPGFGFSKTVEQNYELMRNLQLIEDAFKLPVLVGISRKSMFTKPLGISAEQSLPATVTANTIAAINGASILRVHDVAAARQCVDGLLSTSPSPR